MSLRTFNGIGDTFLHPISDTGDDHKEGKIEETTPVKQIHEAQCVFMPDNTYLGQAENGYTGYPTENKDPKKRKVYGPFRKAFFHSKPGLLFENEFTDINTNITEGNSVVFFGYGFSGSGKTYTLTNSDTPENDGFLKKVVQVDNREIQTIEISEVYPYFPSFLECENDKEYEGFDGKLADGTTPVLFNEKRITEYFIKISTGQNSSLF